MMVHHTGHEIGPPRSLLRKGNEWLWMSKAVRPPSTMPVLPKQTNPSQHSHVQLPLLKSLPVSATTLVPVCLGPGCPCR